MYSDKPIVIIAGPTAVGKTEASILLAQELGAEIVSADSMQIYRGMDIGTAKPTRAEQEAVRHHVIDLVDPHEQFSLASYLIAARAAIGEIAGVIATVRDISDRRLAEELLAILDSAFADEELLGQPPNHLPLVGVGVLRLVDQHVIDGLVDGFATSVRGVGNRLRTAQRGALQEGRQVALHQVAQRPEHAGTVVVAVDGGQRHRIDAGRAAIDRIVDLYPIAREYYCHPEMRGSWSLKDVLPTIAPDLAYDDLEVANGGMAQEAFAEIMQPEISPERRQQLHDALLLYCERDTLAMVRIAHYFEGGEVLTNNC